MDQAKHTMLISVAVSAVAQKLMSTVDFEAARKDTYADMAGIGAKVGADVKALHPTWNELFEKMKSEVEDNCREKARTLLDEAVKQARHEAALHRLRLDRLKTEHEALLNQLGHPDSYHKFPSWEENVPFVEIVKNGTIEMAALVQKFQDDLMKAVQTRHHFNLQHCFMCHLVPMTLAHQLADLYEVK